MLVIIIGLPASGKTTYYNNNELLKTNYNFHDDFIGNFIDGELIDDIKTGKNVCVADPRLCDYEIFKKVMKVFEEYINKNDIRLILFKNDKNACLLNANKKVEDMIIEYSKIYNLNNYKNYNYEIIDVYIYNCGYLGINTNSS